VLVRGAPVVALAAPAQGLRLSSAAAAAVALLALLLRVGAGGRRALEL
jgi:hypothetical protein